MMLKAQDGRPVRMTYGFWSGGATPEFAVESGDGTYVKVDEAVIAVGEDIFWSSDHVQKAIKRIGHDWLKTRRSKYGGNLEVYFPELMRYFHWGSDNEGYVAVSSWRRDDYYTRNLPKDFNFDGHSMTKEEMFRISDALEDISSWRGLCDEYAHYDCFGGKGSRTIQVVLMVVGEGKTVTPLSLVRGCVKSESRPRLMVGDSVSFKKGSGIVIGFSRAGVSIQIPDGKKCSAKPDTVEKLDAAKVESPALEPTLSAGFAFALAKKDYLYRAKIKIVDNISIPVFPAEDQQTRVQEHANAVTCVCPLCGWQLVKTGQDNFECCFCRQTAILVGQTEDELILRLSRRPAKNQFAIRESPCCANCGTFQFEVGRQGKRSTGYCQVANQCLQGFNTCDHWFPRDATTYGSAMRQHITNLGFGVNDSRNVSRNDLRDTIYRAEDHEAQKKRAEAAKTAYTVVYAKFIEELTALGKSLPLVDDKVSDEMKAHYEKALEGGV